MTTRDYGDIQAELATKATETLSAWVSRHNAGKITDRELMIVADALFDTISGLAPWDVSDVIYKVRQEIRAAMKAKRK